VGTPQWGRAAASVETTRAAAVVQDSTLPGGCPQNLCCQQSNWAQNIQPNSQVNSLDQGEAMRRWLLGIEEGPSLSNEELASRMLAAEPETYND